MIEVELPDGRILEFPEGTSQDVMRSAIQGLMGQQPAAPAQPDWVASQVADMNALQGQVDTAGGINQALGSGLEAVGDFARTANVAVDNATESLTGGLIGDEYNAAIETGFGLLGDYGAARDQNRAEEQALRENNPLAYWATEIGPAMMLGGAGTTSGSLGKRVASSAASGGILGALFGGTEAEGGVQERAEGAAQGGLLGGTLGAAIPFAGNLIGRATPSAANRANPERAALAQTLDDAGIRGITAGQRTGSERLLRMEDMLQPAQGQLEDFTGAAMRSLGSTAPRATPEALEAAQRSIVQRMDDALKGVSVTPTPAMAQSVDDIAKEYIDRVPAGQLTPRIRGIADEIADAATSPNSQSFPLSLLRKWRTDIGRLTTSPDQATREAAHSLREIIDDATDNALQSAGRADDIAALGQARNDYRNFLAVSDAVSKAGVNNQVGILSPQALRSSIVRTQGKQSYATGRGTDLAELSRAAAGVLAPLPTVMAGGQRLLPQASSVGPAAIGAMIGSSAGPMGAAAGMLGGGLAGVMGKAAGQAAMRSRPMAGLLANQVRQSPGSLDAPLRRGLLGALAAQ